MISDYAPHLRMRSEVQRSLNGEDLRQWRVILGITQTELAKQAGISQNLICMLERGNRNFTRDTIHKINRAKKTFNSRRGEALLARSRAKLKTLEQLLGLR